MKVRMAVTGGIKRGLRVGRTRMCHRRKGAPRVELVVGIEPATC